MGYHSLTFGIMPYYIYDNANISLCIEYLLNGDFCMESKTTQLHLIIEQGITNLLKYKLGWLP